MNRPIKFRGKTSGGYSVRGKISVPPRTVYGKGVYSDLYGTVIYCRMPQGIRAVEVKTDSIAYFVGVDKYGKDIYEGDIVIDEQGREVVAKLSDNLEFGRVALKEAQS